MTRLFTVIALGTLLLGSPARAQVGNWLDGLWPTIPEQLPIPRAQASPYFPGAGWQAICDWVPEICDCPDWNC
jgi:hypothetical protein